jgi:hypothetical protein
MTLEQRTVRWERYKNQFCFLCRLKLDKCIEFLQRCFQTISKFLHPKSLPCCRGQLKL